MHHIFQTNFYNEIMFIKRYETYNFFIDSILVPNAFLPTKNYEGYVLFFIIGRTLNWCHILHLSSLRINKHLQKT